MDKKLIVAFLCCLFSSGAKAVSLDVVVVYTSGMEAAYPNSTQVKINQMIAWANVAFQNSSTDVQLNVIATKKLDLVNSFETSEDLLSKMVNDSNIVALRNEFKPDLTIYLTKASSTLCGIAYYPKYEAVGGRVRALKFFPQYGNAVVSYDCDSFVLAHEVGHSLGAGHGLMDAAGGNGKPIPSSRGYGVQGLFADVMAYAWLYGNVTKLQYFSSPDVSFLSVPIGTVNDNASRGIKNFSIVASQYSNCYPMTVAPRWYVRICKTDIVSKLF